MQSQAEPERENTHTELFPFSVINAYRGEADPENLQYFWSIN